MEYRDAINKIMSDVRNGSTEPFILYRDGGGWHCDHVQNQYGETFDWVEDVKAQDPFAVTLSGADFSKASFPSVYDTVLRHRLRTEFYHSRDEGMYVGNSIDSFFEGMDESEAQALLDFFEENISELSHEVTDYLATQERPFVTLGELCNLNLETDDPDWTHNEDLTANAIDSIENAVKNRLRVISDKALPEKRSIEGYTELMSLSLAARIVVLAENQQAADPYLICNVRYDNPLGLEERYNGVVTNDYLEAVQIFTNRINELAGELTAEREQRGLPIITLTTADCVPGGLNEHLEGKVIIIDPKVLAPEYRSADHQLKICTGGFGANPTSRGNAVFCKDLYTGKQTRFERMDVLGVANVERIPEWAKNNLNIMLPPDKKPSILGRLNDNRQKVEWDKAVSKDKPAKKRSGDLEV